MNIIESITKGYKKIFPTTWRERETRYGRHLEKVWGMPEGELEKRHKERIKKITDWAKGIFK